MTEFRIDKDYLRMIVDYYERKCPCWGGKHTCPCPPFAQTQECRCGAIRSPSDPKARDEQHKPYIIDFKRLNSLVEDHKCPEDGETCFCKEFLEGGNCRAKIFEKRC